jgi:autotransporter-associated beta strand protein
VSSSVTATIAAAIGGSAGIDKTGAGKLVLTGTNTYSGGTHVDGGTVSINNANALSSGTVVMANGTELNGTATFTLTNTVQSVTSGTFTISAAPSTALTLEPVMHF